MANKIKVTDKVAKVMTEFMNQKSPILNTANRNYVKEASDASGYAPGRTFNAKIPKSQIVSRGLTDTVKGITDKVVPINIEETDMHNVTEELDVIEELLDIVGDGEEALQSANMQALVDNYGVPTYQALSGDLEKKAAEEFAATVFMTPIDTPDKLRPINKFSDISQVRTMMDDLKFPAMRYGMMNNTDAQGVADSLQNSFVTPLNKQITEEKLVDKGRLAGFDMFSSGDLPPHEAGAQFNTDPEFAVASVAADGSTITFKNLVASTTGVFVAGDLISIPSVHLIDSVTKTPRKWKLVVKVTEDVTSDGAGTATVKLSDPLVFNSQVANVDALPAADAKAELFPSHNVNYFYTPAGLSAIPLQIKDIRGAENSSIRLAKTDVAVKCVVQGQILQFTNAFRTSILCPIKAFADYTIVLPSAL